MQASEESSQKLNEKRAYIARKKQMEKQVKNRASGKLIIEKEVSEESS